MKNILLIFGLLWALGASGQIYIDSYRFGGGAPPATLLLDDYPNAAAAYSLRKLRTAYTGNCVEVRRLSDNTTSNIGFSGNYLDTAALKTFCSGTNCFVRTWYDQSTNNRNIQQTTNANQARIVNVGIIDRQDGEVSINFDGSNDFMQIAFTLGQSQTRVSVLAHYSGQNNNHIIYDDGANVDGAYLLFSSTNTLRLFTNTLNLYVTPVLNSVQFVSTGVYAGASTRLTVNNLTPATGVAPAITYSGLTIASRQAAPQFTAQIRIQEVIIYANDRTADISGIHSNINSFYTIY